MRRALPVGLVSLAGLILFCWPFIGTGLPANTPAWALSIGCVAALLLVEAGTPAPASRAGAPLAPLPPIPTSPPLRAFPGPPRVHPPYSLRPFPRHTLP